MTLMQMVFFGSFIFGAGVALHFRKENLSPAYVMGAGVGLLSVGFITYLVF